MPRLHRAGAALAVVLPAALTAFFGFRAGGFFPGATGLVAALFALGLALHVTTAERPLAGLGAAAAVAAGALGLLAGWALVSSAWSDAPARALLEFDRVLLYLLAFVAAAALARRDERVAWAVRALAAAFALLALVALAGRLFPDVLAVDPGSVPERMSWPVTYWNALGLLCALGVVLALHLCAALEERPRGRVGPRRRDQDPPRQQPQRTGRHRRRGA